MAHQIPERQQELIFNATVVLTQISQLYKIQQSFINLKKLKNELASIINIPEFTPALLLQAIEQNSEEIQKHFVEDGDGLRGKVFLTGQLSSQQPIPSTFLKSAFVLFSWIFEQNFMWHNVNSPISNFLFTRNKKKKSANSFYLQDAKPEQPEQKHQLQYQQQYFNKKTHVQKNLSVQTQNCTRYLAHTKTYHQNGEKTEIEILIENVIKKDQVLTIFGEVVYNKLNHTLSIREPKYFSTSKLDIIFLLRSKIFWQKLLAFIFISPVLILLIKFIYKKIKSYLSKPYKIKDMLQSYEIESYKCYLCKQNPRNIVFMPCNHFIICKQCKYQQKISKCNKCNKQITETVDIFIS